MNLDALIFMLSAWGFTLGLLAFCIIMLVKNPNRKSDMSDNACEDNPNRNRQN
jgi:hypothetical protein